jgi:hypothetical protein
VTIDWSWLAATYAGWRIAGLRASGTRDRQELVLTLEREVPVVLPALRLDADQADWDGLDDALAAWRGRDVD